MPEVYLSIGSNLGNREVNLQKAFNLLQGSPGLSNFRVSKIYQTSPVGFLDQGLFLNMVVCAATNLMPGDVLGLCQDIERQMRRVKTVKFGPRNIDLDLLFYDNRVINEDELTVPHPRAHVRKFVLKPMCDLAPDFVHPKLQQSMQTLLAELDDDTQQVEEFEC